MIPLEDCAIYGHGTGSSGDDHAVVESIFQDGLKGWEAGGSKFADKASSKHPEEIFGSTDLNNTAAALWDSSSSQELREIRPALNSSHRGSRNVILMRLPHEYFNQLGDPHERTKPFFTVHEDDTGHPYNYVDRRLIIGNYDNQTGKIELNDYFEPEIEGDFKAELDQRLSEAKQKTEARLLFWEQNPLGIAYDQSQEEDLTEGTGFEGESLEQEGWSNDEKWD